MNRRAPWSPDEEWADIPGHWGTYWVSSHGRVMSRHRSPAGRVLKATPLKGYPAVSLPDPLAPLGQRRITVHTLVAKAFIGPYPPDMQVCHGDSDRGNPRADNLRYDTSVANQRDTLLAGNNVLSSRSHCQKGHPYDEANTRWYRGYRRCKRCEYLNQRAKLDRIRKPPGSRFTTWTPDEIALFAAHTDREIEQITGRTYVAIQLKRVRLFPYKRPKGTDTPA